MKSVHDTEDADRYRGSWIDPCTFPRKVLHPSCISLHSALSTVQTFSSLDRDWRESRSKWCGLVYIGQQNVQEK
jgi:hypothetical protein